MNTLHKNKIGLSLTIIGGVGVIMSVLYIAGITNNRYLLASASAGLIAFGVYLLSYYYFRLR